MLKGRKDPAGCVSIISVWESVFKKSEAMEYCFAASSCSLPSAAIGDSA